MRSRPAFPGISGYRAGMEKPFNLAPRPSWCGQKALEAIVRLGSKRFAVRVRLDSGERATLPLGRVTFQMR
jgi:hypothetical protein